MKIEFTKDIKEIDKVLEKIGKDQELKGKGHSKPHFIPLFFTAKDKKGKIAGYLYAYDINDGYFREILLDDLLIDDEFKRKGYGTKLVESLIKYCKSMSVETIILKVNKNKKDAVKLYEKCGFKIDNDIVFMQLEMPPRLRKQRFHPKTNN